MTAAEIEGVPAGRELDALVAEHVMGYRRWVVSLTFADGHREEEAIILKTPLWEPSEEVPSYYRSAQSDEGPAISTRSVHAYSTSLGQTLEVVEKLLERWDVRLHLSRKPGTSQRCVISDWAGNRICATQETTMPLAICRAALLAVWATE